MITATASWAIYGAVRQWVGTPDRASAEEFVSVAAELVRAILTAGTTPAPSANRGSPAGRSAPIVL